MLACCSVSSSGRLRGSHALYCVLLCFILSSSCRFDCVAYYFVYVSYARVQCKRVQPRVGAKCILQICPTHAKVLSVLALDCMLACSVVHDADFV